MNETGYIKTHEGKPRVVIIGGGFGGLYAARTLHNAPVRVTLIDRNNHHTFSPLLYQVATGSLGAEEVTAPIRSVLRNQKNAEVLMGEVKSIDTAAQCVYVHDEAVFYDYLIIATGTRHAYFGHPEWEQNAPGLKTIADATEIRQRIFLAFEAAEAETDETARQAWMTFVVVGAGPTGVEIAGQLAEISHQVLSRDFRHVDPKSARILLVEAGPRILATFHESLSAASQKYLEKMGVEIHTSTAVEKVDETGVLFGGQHVASHAVVWAAGNMASPLLKTLNVPQDKAGRIVVEPNLNIPGHDNVFVIGDAMSLKQNDKPLPGVAQVPIQQGKYVAHLIRDRIAGKPAPPPFRYFNKGNMATVGRAFAIYDLDALYTPGGTRIFGSIRFAGFFAWLMWLGIHVFYLIGFSNRLYVMMRWAWAYLTFQRGARIIEPTAASPTPQLPDRLTDPPLPDAPPVTAHNASEMSSAKDGKEREPAPVH